MTSPAPSFRTRQPLWFGALRSRPVINLLLLLLSAAAVLVAALGPLLFRAIQQSSVADTIAAASPDGTTVTVVANVAPHQDAALFEPTVAGILAPTAERRPAVWNPPTTWVETTGNVSWTTPAHQGHGEASSRVQLAEKRCRGVVLVAGRCPAAADETLVSADDAAAVRITPGTSVVYRIGQIGKNVEGRLTVVGTYDPVRTAVPLTRPGKQSGDQASVNGDPLLVTDKLLVTLPLSSVVSSRITVREPIDLAGLEQLRSTVPEIQTAIDGQAVVLTVKTTLDDVVARAGVKSSAALVLVGVTEVQALSLGLFALCVVLHRVAQSRSPEWATGRLLGVPWYRRLGAAFAEPAISLVLGAPLGLAAAVAAARVSVAVALRHDTAVEVFRWPVLVAGAAALAASLVALVVVSLPSVTRPLAEVVQGRSEARRVSRLGAVAQALVVVLAGTTLYQLLAGGVLTTGGSQLGLLAPGLFALALAVLVVRLAVLVVRGITRRPTRSLVGIVVARQAARVPTSLNPAVVIAVGVALTVFATQVLALSVRNEERRAEAINGAPTVLQVSTPSGVDLRQAVRTADPGGRYAMAAMERTRQGEDGTDRVLAVDTSRLTSVASWDPRWSGVADLAAALHPPTTPTIVLRGRRLEVDVDGVGIQPQADQVPPVIAPQVVVIVDDGQAWRTIRLGALGSATTFRRSMDCAAGCRLVGIGLASQLSAPYQAQLTVTGVGTDVQPVAESRSWLRDSGRWHSRVGDVHTPTPDASAIPHGTPSGLQLIADDQQGGAEAIADSSDVTDPVPAVVGPQTELTPLPAMVDTYFGHGIDGDPQLLHLVGTAVVLPRLLGDGVLVDLDEAVGRSDPALNEAHEEVWLAPDAPAEVEPELVAAGLRIEGRDRLDDVTAVQLREPTTRAASVGVTLAYAALLLSLIALVAARVADAPRRRADWRSLQDAGVHRRTLRRLAAVEIGGPALFGTGLGLVSGVVALVLAASRLPVVDLASAGPPLDLGISGTALLTVVVAAVVPVAVVAVGGALLETRSRAEDAP